MAYKRRDVVWGGGAAYNRNKKGASKQSTEVLIKMRFAFTGFKLQNVMVIKPNSSQHKLEGARGGGGGGVQSDVVFVCWYMGL